MMTPPEGVDLRAADVLALLRSAGDHPIMRCFPQGALIVFDSELRYLSAGGLGLSDVGLSKGMLEGHTIFEVFPPEVTAVIEPRYRWALAGEESAMDVPYEGRIYLMRLAPLRDSTGTVVAGMGFTQDVTVGRATEAALRESENRFRTAFEHAPIGKALIGVDGRFRQVNPALCTITGYSQERLLELTVADVTDSEDVAADSAVMDRLLDGEAWVDPLEKRYVTASGGTVWTTTSLSLVRGADGAPLHFISQVQDITERKTHDQLLADERRRLRDAEAIGHVGSWEMDVRADTITWSDALFRLYGLDPARFAGNYQAALDCIHPEDRHEVDAATGACLQTGAPMYVRYRVIRASDGSLRWFDARGEALHDGGQLVRLTGAVADVTDQVRAEAEAATARDAALEASRHKSAFLATMSHEIRTPLNAVIGLTGLLLDTNLDTEQRNFVETVRDSGDALMLIINDILDFSKIESGELQLEQEPFDLWECVEGSLDLLSTAAATRGLDLVSYLGGSPRRVVGDATRLRQVLVNLLSNGIKFTDRGEVLLEVAPEELTEDRVRLRVSVTDSGIGIPANRLDRLFKSFSQVDASTTRVYGGTGLGLAISQRTVEAMGGQLSVISEVGRGSVFSFTVLLTRCQQADPPGGGPLVDLSGRTALLVVGNPTNLRILQMQLQGWGVAGTVVGCAQDALALVGAGTRYDLAVIDMDLPTRDGRQLAAKLHRLPAGSGLPVVVLTSMGSGPERRGNTDFAAVLTKPVRSLALHQALQSALRPVPESGARAQRRRRADTAIPPPRLRVLLAEDNAVNQRVGRLMLDKLGHHVDTVGNGREAVAALHQMPYDVVLMDMHMPEMDGLEATRRIRAEIPAPRQPHIVALTAAVTLEDRQECAQAGMDDYLSKPVRAADLAAALSQRVPRPPELTDVG